VAYIDALYTTYSIDFFAHYNLEYYLPASVKRKCLVQNYTFLFFDVALWVHRAKQSLPRGFKWILCFVIFIKLTSNIATIPLKGILVSELGEIAVQNAMYLMALISDTFYHAEIIKKIKHYLP
jgi:hypothetical protein